MRNIKSSCNGFEDISRKVCVVQILQQNKTTFRHTMSSMKTKKQDIVLAKDHEKL